MSGTIDLGDGVRWSTRSGVFYWVIDSIADRASQVGLALQLREVSEANIGWVDVPALDPGLRTEFLNLLAVLPEVARATLPSPAEGREAVLAQIDELAGLASRLPTDSDADGAGGPGARPADPSPREASS